MKSVLFVVSLFIAGPLLADPTHCPIPEMDKDTAEVLQLRREKTFDHCLSCQGERCELKAWPADENSQKLAHMCRIFFCTPIKRPRSAFAPEIRDMQGEFHFTYEINRKGRADNFVITTYSGDIDLKEAKQWAQALYKRRKYEPVTIGDNTYVITNLAGSSRVKGDVSVRFGNP